MRSFVIFSAVLACTAMLAAGAPSFSVVSSPSYIQTRSSESSSMAHSDVSEILSGCFGLASSPQSSEFTKTSPFETPASGLVVEFSTECDACLPDGLEAHFTLTQESATSPLSDVTARFTSVFGKGSVVQTEAVASDIFSLARVPSVSVSGGAVTLGDGENAVAITAPAMLLNHLAGLLRDVDDVLAADSESPVVVLVTLDVASIDASSAALVKAVLAFAAKTLSDETHGNSLVTVHTFVAPTTMEYRRDIAAEPITDIRFVSNNANLTQHDSAWVEYCTTYKCFCYADKDGNPWDPETRCKKNCNRDPCDDCVYLGCDCGSATVTKSQSQCIKCAEGYVVIGDHCYLDTDMPSAVNIILWLGLGLFFGFLVTCAAIGNMDPGYDSIIYRMTRQRIKAQ